MAMVGVPSSSTSFFRLSSSPSCCVMRTSTFILRMQPEPHWKQIHVWNSNARVRHIAAYEEAEIDRPLTPEEEEEQACLRQYMRYSNRSRKDDRNASELPPISQFEFEGPEEEEDRECISQILQVLDLLKKNREMPVNEVRLIVMIEDPREVEERLMGREDDRGCSREDMADALLEIAEGKVPDNRVVLRALRDELISWPNLEGVMVRSDPSRSPYAQVTNTGVDPLVAAERAKVDWDAAAEIKDVKQDPSEIDGLPPVLGFGVLYGVSAIPIIIGISVVATLYYSSLQ